MAGNVVQGGVTQVGAPQRQPGALDYMQMAASLMGQVQQYKAGKAQMELAQQQKKAEGLAFLLKHKELADDPDTLNLFGLTAAQAEAVKNTTPDVSELLNQSLVAGITAKTKEEIQAAIPGVKKAYDYIDTEANAITNAVQAEKTVTGNATAFNGPEFVTSGFSQEGTKQTVIDGLAKNRNELNTAIAAPGVTDYDKEQMITVRDQYQAEINRVVGAPDGALVTGNIQGINLNQSLGVNANENIQQKAEYGYGEQSTPDQFIGTEEKKRLPSTQAKPELGGPMTPTTRAKDAVMPSLYERPIEAEQLKDPKKKGLFGKLFSKLKKTNKKIEDGTATQADYMVKGKGLEVISNNLKTTPKKNIEVRAVSELANDPAFRQMYALYTKQQGAYGIETNLKIPMLKKTLTPEQSLKYQELQIEKFALLEEASNNLSKQVLDYNKTKKRNDPEFLLTTPGKGQALSVNKIIKSLGFEGNQMYIQEHTDLGLWARQMNAGAVFWKGAKAKPRTSTLEIDTGLETKAAPLSAKEQEKLDKEAEDRARLQATQSVISADEQDLMRMLSQ